MSFRHTITIQVLHKNQKKQRAVRGSLSVVAAAASFLLAYWYGLDCLVGGLSGAVFLQSAAYAVFNGVALAGHYLLCSSAKKGNVGSGDDNSPLAALHYLAGLAMMFGLFGVYFALEGTGEIAIAILTTILNIGFWALMLWTTKVGEDVSDMILRMAEDRHSLKRGRREDTRVNEDTGDKS